MSISKSLVLAFIWILLLSFIFILFVYILGVEQVINLASTDNIDNLSPVVQSTKYWFSGTRPLGTWPSSIPVASNSELFIFRQGGQTRWVQLLYDINVQQAFFRTKSGVSVSDWYEFSLNIPSFYKNYSNINDLYSVINGMFGVGELNNVNANDITKNCIGSISLADQASAMNYPVAYGYIIHLDSKGYFGIIQICINSEATQIWTRKKAGSSSSIWSSWSRII